MFPEISKSKKKSKIGTQLMQKEVDDVMKELSVKVKKALKIIDNQLASDFNKVCRLKEIPEFYSNYFLHFIQKSSQKQMKAKMAEEIEKIMMGKSYFNLISNLLKQREKNILQIQKKMSIVQGFTLMNAGKALPISIKSAINQMIKDCQTLQGLKIVQLRAINDLSSLVKEIRDKLKQLVEIYISWKFTLHSLQGADTPSIKKLKIIFPYNGINCIFNSLYDLENIKTSFLAQQVKFLKVEFDPFLLHFETIKKRNKLFQQNFVEFLNNQATKNIYESSQNMIIAQIPKDIEKIKQQEMVALQKRKIQRQTKSASKILDSRPESKDKKRKKNKQVGQEYLHSKIILQNKNETESKIKRSRINSMKNIINIDMIDKIYSKKKKSIIQKYQLDNSKSKGSKQQQKNIQKSQIVLQKPKTSHQNRNKLNKNLKKSAQKQKQIENLYSLKKKRSQEFSPQKSLEKSLVKSQNLEIMIQENKKLEKEISEQKREKEKLMKIVKRVESRTQSQNKFYQKKMKQYQRQMDNLKEKLKQRQDKVKQKRIQKQSFQKSNKKNQIEKIYKMNRDNSSSPFLNLAQSQLTEQKQNNKHLESTIKQLNKEKIKLQKLLQSQAGKINKQKALYQKKLQKYEDIIEKLKQQVELSKANSRINNNGTVQAQYSSLKNNNQSIRNIYKKQSKNINESQNSEVQKSVNSFNFTNLIVKEVKRVKNTKKSPVKIQKAQNKANQLEITKIEPKYKLANSNQLQILQDKKRNAIQIIYDKSRRKNSKNRQNLNQKNVQEQKKFSKTNQFQVKVSKLQKQKQLLQKKLSITADNRSSIEVTLMKQLQTKQTQLEKYKNILQREEGKKYGLELKMKQVRKSLADQYQNRLQRERQRFLSEKQTLMKKLQEEKQQKRQKQKFLSKQLIFLKEMQIKQQELLSILEHQRNEKQLKQIQLQNQMQKKQQALRLLQIEQIKKQIQFQVRKQLEYEQQQDQELEKEANFDLIQRKKQMQKQIQDMILDNNQELNEIDQQNEKLKDLIKRIKQEQQKVIQTMKFDVGQQNDEEQEAHLMTVESLNIQNQKSLDLMQSYDQNVNNKKTEKNLQLQNSVNVQVKSQFSGLKNIVHQSNKPSFVQNLSKLSQKNLQLTKQLKLKTDLQLQKQEMSFSRLKQIESSPQYKDRQKIQELIEHYLAKPFQYPKQKNVINSHAQKKQYKNELIKELTIKSNKIRQFQQELLAVKHMQNFVPAERDDPLTAHMLNLRQAYQNQQADQLKRILFPVQIQEFKQQNQHELSFESDQTPPPVTLLDHLKIHEKQYKTDKKAKKLNNKNFLTINKIKLLQIQEQKKDKQRSLIDEATKNRIQALKMREKLLKAKAQREKLEQQQKNNPSLNIKEQKKKKKTTKRPKIKPKQQTNNKNQKKSSQQKKQQKILKKVINDKNIVFQPLQNQTQNQFLDDEVLKKMQNDQLQRSQKFIKKQEKVEKKDEDLQQKQEQEAYSENYQDQKQEEQEEQEENFDNFNDNEFLQHIQMLDEQIYGKKEEETIKQENTQKEQIKQDEKNEFLQNQQKQNKQEQNNEQQVHENSENIALMLLQSQKAKLQSDILSYQDDIRSYLSQEEYEIYQYSLNQNQLKSYVKDILQLSSQQIVALNNNETLLKDLQDSESIAILIAKDYERSLQIGIGIFHKEYASDGQYVCDFVLAHNMKYFLNMIFNFCRYIFKKDAYTKQVQFIFSLEAIEQELTLLHFSQFQAKCKRLGQVYVKSHTDKKRKYILKRNLFQNKGLNYQYPQQYKGLQIKTKVQIHQKFYKQKGKGFTNPHKVQYSSLDILLAYHFKNNQQELAIFRKKTQNDLKYRELLITSLLFQKKQISIKSIHQKHLNEQQKQQVYESLANVFFDISYSQKSLITETFFGLSGDLSKTVKRCLLNFEQQDTPYLIMHPAQAVNQIQSSNSSQTGTFLNLAPKYKILILSAEQYFMMENQNSDISVFFYVKHFIKNICEVKKQSYSRVYLPQINSQTWLFHKDLSEKLQQTIFEKQQIQIGWKNELYNSLIYEPHHRDLIIQKPFIISLLSANIQKVVEGSPIFCKLIK